MFTVFLLCAAASCGFLAGIFYVDSEMHDEFFVSGADGDTFMVGPFLTMSGAKYYGASCYSNGQYTVTKKKIHRSERQYV